MDHLTAWRDAQRAVIGSLLIDPEHTAGAIFGRARPEHFGEPSWRHIFLAARELWTQRRPVDVVTVAAAAGDEYHDALEDAMVSTPTAVNAEAYLDLIRDGARLSAIRAAAFQISTAQNLDAAAKLYEQLGQTLRDRDEFEDKTLEEAIGEYLDRMQDPTPPDYLRFGIPELDRFLAVSRGQFVILAADSSVGKTALALQFAYAMAEAGRKVGFFSLETSRENLVERLLAELQAAAVNLPRSKQKQLTDRDFRRVTEAAMRRSARAMRLLNRFRTVEQIRARTVMHGFDVIFVDYVQLLEAEGENRWNIVTNVSMGLHRLAQELGVTVVGLSQITPEAKGSKSAPTKDDLRESRQLKHDADVILMMSLSKEGAGVFRELGVVKNKDGPLGRILLDFEAENMSFRYRAPMEQSNAYAEVRKASKRARRERAEGQQGFDDLGDDEGGDLPF